MLASNTSAGHVTRCESVAMTTAGVDVVDVVVVVAAVDNGSYSRIPHTRGVSLTRCRIGLLIIIRCGGGLVTCKSMRRYSCKPRNEGLGSTLTIAVCVYTYVRVFVSYVR